MEQVRSAIEAMRPDFTWERVLAPLVEFCIDPKPAADRDDVFSRRRSVPRGSFDRILIMPRGIRRDFALLRYYFARGGSALLARKFRERWARRAPR
jgi:hypothetical protein